MAAAKPNLGAAYVVIAAALAVIVGSIGPWATVTIAFLGQMKLSGQSCDGEYTVWGGVIAGLLMGAVCLNPRRAGIAALSALLMLLVAGIGIYDWMNVNDAVSDARGERFVASASVGWGLVMVTIGGLIGAIAAIVQAISSPVD